MGYDIAEKRCSMVRIRFAVVGTLLISALLLVASCQSGTSVFEYRKWTVSGPILTKGPEGSFDDVSVKDPSIVFYNGKYHVFYTSIAGKKSPDQTGGYSIGVGYVSATSLEGLNSAKRYNLYEIIDGQVIAPQVFYFEPHGLWYIIAQTPVKAKPDLAPVYLTNPDIDNVHGWSKPKTIKTRKSNNGFWIDFWVICDEAKAHLFYTDHEGSLFRFECPIDKFPDGFADEKEETVLTERGENELGRWRLHEGSHIYYVKKAGKYVALLEAVYPHPTKKNYWESRNRFMFAMTANKTRLCLKTHLLDSWPLGDRCSWTQNGGPKQGISTPVRPSTEFSDRT
jgi:endo-1,4-beta-xylanase